MPIAIQTGKVYRTKKGHEVLIVSFNPAAAYFQAYRGYIGEYLTSFNAVGECQNKAHYDLIEEVNKGPT